MGIVGFTHFFKKCIETKHIKNYCGSTIIVDAIFQIFRYSIAIRNSGSDIVNEQGKRLNHIWAIMQYTIYLWRLGIKPIFIFDGKAPLIKKETLMARKKERTKANLQILDLDETSPEYIKYFKKTFCLTGQEIKDCIELLEYLGVPYLRENGEADLYCAPIMKSVGNIKGVVTNDTDLLVFGTDRILKNFSGNKMVEEISLESVYSHITTKINDIYMSKNIPPIKHIEKTALREILIDLSILLGCDYTPHIKGIKIDQLFETYVLHKFDLCKTVEQLEKNIVVPEHFIERALEAKKYYMQSDVIQINPESIKRNEPNKDKIYEFLHKKNNISESHTNNFLRQIDKFFYKKKTYSDDRYKSSPQKTDNRGYYVNKKYRKLEYNRTVNKYSVLSNN